MLAEKRKKQRFATDPRNNNWTNDESNNIGMKLMSKMGWSKGKGLGKEEQGLSTSDKLMSRPKIDNKGFGCDTKDVEAWETGSNAFESLLAKLNQNNQATCSNSTTKDEQIQEIIENNDEKTEQKSEKLLKRIRYKTTKAKDASKYSNHDLKCILGRRKAEEDDNQQTKTKFSKAAETLFQQSMS